MPVRLKTTICSINSRKPWTGGYDIYAFQQLDGSPLVQFLINLGSETWTFEFDRRKLPVEGQTRGEWICLGTYRIPRNSGGSIRIQSDTPNRYSDGIRFIPW